MRENRVNLKALNSEGLSALMKEMGLPPFRARQIAHWIYEKYAQSVEEMTELSKPLRQALSERAYISNLVMLDRKAAADGTEKFLFGLDDGESIESVLIPDSNRLALCISSQVGCAMGCAFCLTGRMGLRRNLKAFEIVDQIMSAARTIAPRRITNIVMMGMGEPLANLDEVAEALWRMARTLKISPRRITLSTSGLAPLFSFVAQKAPKVNLAISLNATTDEVRNSLMPVNRRYPLKELLAACRAFPLAPRRRITFEYVLLRDINDTVDDARRLLRLLKGIPSKVNLIPFNPFPGADFERPEDSLIIAFQQVLIDGGLTAMIRKSKGQEILAACGQLKAQYPIGASR